MTGFASVQQEAAREAGKSFVNLVKEYAEANHSMTETASLLGYKSPTGFIRMCNRYGWREWFPLDGRSGGALQAKQASIETRRGVDTPAMAAARRKLNYGNVLYRGKRDTIAGHARTAGVPVKTAYKRLRRRPGDYEYAFYAGSYVRAPDQSEHWWNRE